MEWGKMEWKPISVVYYCVLLLMRFHGTLGNGYTMRMFHKLSDEAKSVMQERTGKDLEWWPKKSSSEYFRELIMHDNFRHSGRRELLESADSTLAFDPSNVTYWVSPLGGLHYTLMSIGTPNTTFLVAIDTGSDLLWLPCDCQQCAPTDGSNYGLSGSFSVYSPSDSSTSTAVPCGSNVCKSTVSATSCIGSTSCPYLVQYASQNTSSSGFLVEDTLYLVSGKQGGNSTTANIVFGCGQVQTGILEQGVAPDGLLGLGMENVSVPSTLANTGLVKDSFSVCLGDDFGTLIFGDKGGPNMSSTPFQLTQSTDLYVLLLDTLIVSNVTSQASTRVLFDTGTAITRFTSPTYELLAESINKVVNLQRINLSGIPFEHCWETSKAIEFPVTMEFFGGSRFTTYPFVIVVNQLNQTIGTCLYVLRDNISIIGYNFMVGYRWIYDREKMLLGWQESDCFDLDEELNTVLSPAISPSTSPPTRTAPSGVEASSSTEPFSQSLSPTAPTTSSSVQSKPNIASFITLLLLIYLILR